MQENKHNGYRSSGYNNGNNMFGNQYGGRNYGGHGYTMPHNGNADLAAVAHGFQGMSLQNQQFAAQAKNAMMGNGSANYGGVSMAQNMPSAVYGASSQYMYPNAYAASTNSQSPSVYTPHAPQYMPQHSYAGYQQHDNSPMSQNWTPTTVATGEVPTLITPRRDSISSNENDQPATPSYAGYPNFTHGGVAINRSPSGVYTHSSPSPTSVMGPYGLQYGKHPSQSDVSPRIKILVAQEPIIPRAIPAPSSPLKPLDRALENQRGETNVYIRGLLPETSDEMLEAFGGRFGDIKSSKAILDIGSGLCKGFGFVKYHNYEDAENCIRGFHYLGYEVSFARESFYSKLKTFSNEGNTNLYVSNLPRTMNEHDLTQLFLPLKACSTRILRDKSGDARGVGFARFDSRADCEEVIAKFNNHVVQSDGDELQIQIRYADTQEQKALKQQTQAARHFRSVEYEYATQALRLSSRAGSVESNMHSANEFEQYHGNNGANVNVHAYGQRWTPHTMRKMLGRQSLAGSTPYSKPGATPLAQINVAATPDSNTDDGTPLKSAGKSPVSVKASSPVDSVATLEQH